MRKACIIGYPVSHSRSPMIHNHWLGMYHIDGSYDFAEVKPEDFAPFIGSMLGNGFVGGNITIPHKTSLLSLSKYRTASADAAGAANTLWFENGESCVDNTDVIGFLVNLDIGATGWDRHATTAVVLGAGGASRGIIYGLLQRGFTRIIVANRTYSASEALVAVFGQAIVAIHWHETERWLAEADLLVNTTSLGMYGQPQLDLKLINLPSHAVVTDAVYVPLETSFLTTARLRGLRTVCGLGMLLHQAAPGFERWFGIKPTVTPELTRLIEDDIERGY